MSRISLSTHWMNRMLNPRSVAVVGVSSRKGGIGHLMFKYLVEGGFKGKIYPVNPRFKEYGGHKCYPSLTSLPEVPDLVILGVGGSRIEQIFDEALNLEVGGVVIFFNNYLANDSQPPLLARMRTKAEAAGIPVCGGNGMGFYNYDLSLVASFDRAPKRPPGHITLIAHSGSVATYLANTDARYMFNLVVSPGQEVHGSAADYLEFALDQPSTRVVALFLEAIRNPLRFRRSLEIAYEKQIPVVITKVGRTEKSARFAASHSGALAGNDTAFQAICDRYGVIRTQDMDEMLNTAMLFAQGRQPAAGGLASILDSGGLREQMIDLAEEMGVPFAEISLGTRDEMGQALEFGLDPDNPLDAMGTFTADLEGIWSRCLQALATDPDTAMISMEFEFRDSFSHYPQLFKVAHQMLTMTHKPAMVVSSSAAAIANLETAAKLTQAGVPVVHGVANALKAVKNVLAFRDRRPMPQATPKIEAHLEDQWRAYFRSGQLVDESVALRMLADFSLPVVPHKIVYTRDICLQAAADIGFPVVLKTAERIPHKSDVGGVRLNLADAEAVGAVFDDFSERLGPRVMVAPMVESGVELVFGMINDPQYGPVVMVGAGGIYVEVLEDRCFALAPFDKERALELIKQLKIYPLMTGIRGREACRIDMAAEALAQFSALAYALGDTISEIDANPVIITPSRAMIVDALVVIEK